MRKKQFLKNTLIMAVTAIMTRCLGLGLRSFLTESVGAEGIGIYQLILTVYFFAAAVSVSGAGLAVTRLVSEERAKKHISLSVTIVRKCVIYAETGALILGFLMFFFSESISRRILGDSRCAAAMKILALSLPFMAFSACVRGYFTALRKVIPTSAEQLIEQLSEIAVCVFLLMNFMPKTPESACAAISLGTLSAEIISFVYSFLLYFWEFRKLKRQDSLHDKMDFQFKKIWQIALPVTANSALRSGLSAVENILIPVGLFKYGADSTQAISHYGILTGLAMPVITFPMVLIIPASSLIVPEISEAAALKNHKAVRRMTMKLIKVTLLYSVPIAVSIAVFSGQLGEMLYQSREAGKYIAALSPVIPLMCLDSAADGILKGMNLQTNYLLINTADSIIRILLTIFLIPVLGPLGAAAIIVFSELFNVTLSLWGALRNKNCRQN